MDETGTDTWLCREHGWSERGAPVVGEVRGRKHEGAGVVAALMGKSLIEPCQCGGTMESGFFEEWFARRLLPALPEGSVTVTATRPSTASPGCPVSRRGRGTGCFSCRRIPPS